MYKTKFRDLTESELSVWLQVYALCFNLRIEKGSMLDIATDTAIERADLSIQALRDHESSRV